MRNRVEIWADGGYRHAHDIVKLLCLGANRVGFGTLAMVSLGCTICRGCQLDTCHVGIATQIEAEEEAAAQGPQEVHAAGATSRPSRAARASSRRWARRSSSSPRRSASSAPRTWSAAPTCSCRRAPRERVDVDELIRPLEEMLDLEPLDLPVPADEREAAGLVAARPLRMAVGRPAGACSGTAGRAATLARERIRVARAGRRARSRRPPPHAERFAGVAGQGLGAFNVEGVDITVEGGAQDGVAKTMYGGKVAVMKGENRLGRRVNGSVGKSFAYGAQRGRLFVQGDADSRFCIRLSGADVVIGGEPRGAARRLARLPRRPRQPQGLRLRVHDRRARRGARRPRARGSAPARPAGASTCA